MDGLSPDRQPVSEPFEEPTNIWDVEVDVVGEVRADVGVRPHQGAVECSPSNTDHHRHQTQQQQDETRVSSHLVYKEDMNQR